MVALEAARSALADEWTRRSPSSPSEIVAFYRESECLGDDLEAWHSMPERQEWTQAIVAIAGANRVQTVLDVGAGGGHDLRALIASHGGIQAHAVEPNYALRHALPVGAHETIETAPLDYFDMVVCIDVLEHVPDPEALLAEVIARVKMGGILVEASATHDQATPLHLPEFYGWEPTDSLRAAGFVAREQFGRLVVWQREEIETMPTILVVAHREVSVPTVECLFEMVGLGWPIGMVYGDALVDRARAKAASSWYLNETSDVFLMIDDDIVFKPEHAARVVALAREKRAIACAAYPVGDGGHLASRGWPGTLQEFGEAYEPREIRWPATGFMAVHRDVIEAMTKSMDVCYPGQPDRFWPMFQPFAFEGNYLSEDYAFGQRARDLGFATWLDPKSILIHLKIKGLSVLNMPGAEVRQRDGTET